MSTGELERLDRAQGCLLGQLAGDSLGSLVEFRTESSIRNEYPNGVSDLADGGTYDILAGQPTDDSEMALSLARSIVALGRFDARHVLESYVAWRTSGPFDIGYTISMALKGIHDPQSQANGALMRISPLGIFGAGQELCDVARWAKVDAELTHVHPVCGQVNALYAMAIAWAIREQRTADQLYFKIQEWATQMQCNQAVLDVIQTASSKPPESYSKHKGWVMTAFGNALWQLLHARDLEHAVMDTVIRGGDSDTNAAIIGALMGALHGRSAVPKRWEEKILACRPDEANPDVVNPRPRQFWPVDALELAQALFEAGAIDKMSSAHRAPA